MSESNLASSWDVDRVRDDIAALGTLVSAELAYLKQSVNEVGNEVIGVKTDVASVKDDLYSFKVRFEEFVDDVQKKNNITHAQGQIIILNQEIEKKFGLYAKVRNNLLGILQAVDTGLVSKKVITNSTEELMIGTPKYWLSPCLIAIAAWLNNNSPLANKALNEGLKRNKIKTELLFTLISNRLKRQNASFAWLSKFFETQNPLQMPQETLVLVNAYTDGVFGPDSQGICMQQISKWMNYLSQKPDIVQELEDCWVKKIKIMKSTATEDIPFNYLQEYCKEFPVLMNLLNYARKHEVFLNYLKNIINAQKTNKSYVEELDDILHRLINEYDTDEFELRKKHRLCELIVEYEGDKELAEQDFDANVVSIFRDKVTFFDILLNAVTQDNISPNLKKLSLILMKEWIINAHQDFTVKYRQMYLPQITISIEDWTETTKTGSDPKRIYKSYKEYLKRILDSELSKLKPNIFLIILLCIFTFRLITAFGDASVCFFIISLIALIWNIVAVNKKKNQLKQIFQKKCDSAESLIHAICAEYVDWQKAYKEEDKKANEIQTLLNNYNAQEFSKNSAKKKILLNQGE